ncbi:nuclease-like protein [Actinobacteria bacterium IMCC26256]|nr:nuclease-like protein [Actinobacteria bacterium IMCC26256]
MARMIPPVFDPMNPSPGERILFDQLRDDSLTERWTALHSLDLPKHINQSVGEIDFVVIIPGQGVVCCEVKGHKKIRRVDGAWYLGQNQSPDYRGPFKQAADGMYSLRQRVRTAMPDQNQTIFTSVVIVPFLDDLEKQQHAEWEDWQLITKKKLNETGIGNLLTQAIEQERQRQASPPKSSGFELKKSNALVSYLRPDFEMFVSPAERRLERRADLLRFTGEQLEALDLMGSNRQTLFEGPAGTGKTVLAIEEARRAALSNEKVLFICYNNWLAKKIAREFKDEEAVTVRTLGALYLDIVGRETPAIGRDSEWWDHELREQAIEVLLDRGYPGDFDLMIIDEAQDIFALGGLEVIDLIGQDLLRSGRWRMFGDFERQAIFGDPSSALAELRNISPQITHFPLTKNCRNTPRIVSFIEMASGMVPGYAKILRSDDKVDPSVSYYKNETKQGALLQQSIESLLEEGFENGEIAVLSPKRKGISTIINGDLQEQLGTDSESLDDDLIVVATIRKFKGLDRPAVIITDIDDVSTPASEAMFYTGMTRATDRLIVLIAHDQQANVRDKLAKFAQIKGQQK